MSVSTARRATDLVSLGERLLMLRVLRVAVAAIVVLDAALLPQVLRVSLPVVAGVALGYVLSCLLAEALWRWLGRPSLWLFGSLTLLDGLFLGVASWMDGGSVGPARYLVLVHLAAVTLLASYRTGVKLALWDSLVQVCLFYAERSGWISGPGGNDRIEWFGLVAFIVAMWVSTIAISSLTAVNERELRRRRFELEQLASMGHALEDAHDALSVGEKLLAAITDTFGFTRMAIFAVNDDGPRLLTCTGLIDAVVADFRLQSDSVLAVAYEERRSLLVKELDPEADPWLAAVMPRAVNVMVVPMIADGVVGVLIVETGESVGGRVERRVLATTERFAGHAALAMRNANLLERVKMMAATDGLTGLANRRSFDEILDRELLRAGRTDGRLSIVLIDIDEFKLLNDTHGHVVGDSVLRSIAAALRSCGREYDTIARFGGEEFAAILPGCSSGLAVQVAERLRLAVQECPHEVPVTASCGVSTYPYDGLDAMSLVQAADDALYASKRAGRNTVRSAEQARAIARPVAG